MVCLISMETDEALTEQIKRRGEENRNAPDSSEVP